MVLLRRRLLHYRLDQAYPRRGQRHRDRGRVDVADYHGHHGHHHWDYLADVVFVCHNYFRRAGVVPGDFLFLFE